VTPTPRIVATPLPLPTLEIPIPLIPKP
jgi:hypothetical protein